MVSPLSLVIGVMSDIRIARKLEHICQGLTLPAEEGKAVEFLTNTENAQKINGLVEDTHEALIDYQVWILNQSFLLCLNFMLDFIATGYL